MYEIKKIKWIERNYDLVVTFLILFVFVLVVAIYLLVDYYGMWGV